MYRGVTSCKSSVSMPGYNLMYCVAHIESAECLNLTGCTIWLTVTETAECLAVIGCTVWLRLNQLSAWLYCLADCD